MFFSFGYSLQLIITIQNGLNFNHLGEELIKKYDRSK